MANDNTRQSTQQLTQRKRDEEHKKLLAEEMQHRTKNLIAVTGSIANRTLSNDAISRWRSRPQHQMRKLPPSTLAAELSIRARQQRCDAADSNPPVLPRRPFRLYFWVLLAVSLCGEIFRRNLECIRKNNCHRLRATIR